MCFSTKVRPAIARTASTFDEPGYVFLPPTASLSDIDMRIGEAGSLPETGMRRRVRRLSPLRALCLYPRLSTVRQTSRTSLSRRKVKMSVLQIRPHRRPTDTSASKHTVYLASGIERLLAEQVTARTLWRADERRKESRKHNASQNY